MGPVLLFIVLVLGIALFVLVGCSLCWISWTDRLAPGGWIGGPSFSVCWDALDISSGAADDLVASDHRQSTKTTASMGLSFPVRFFPEKKRPRREPRAIGVEESFLVLLRRLYQAGLCVFRHLAQRPSAQQQFLSEPKPTACVLQRGRSPRVPGPTPSASKSRAV